MTRTTTNTATRRANLEAMLDAAIADYNRNAAIVLQDEHARDDRAIVAYEQAIAHGRSHAEAMHASDRAHKANETERFNRRMLADARRSVTIAQQRLDRLER